MTSKLPRIIITMGDPAGIGPEIIIKALASPAVFRACRPIVIGDRRLLPGPLPSRSVIEHIPVDDIDAIETGRDSAVCGRAAYAWIRRASDMLGKGEADALVTAPLSKAALHLAGVHFAGHTEMLASLSGTKDFGMLMAAGRLRAVMVTRHMPLADTGKKIRVKDIVDTTRLSVHFLRGRCGIKAPRIAICAMNPHAGEGGLLGREEGKVISPAIAKLAALGVSADGPLPGDSAWMKMIAGRYDLLVTMYHDQAMIGLKCCDPEKIVNITMGLPFIRTSPGHGTGFDIAGRDRARPGAMIESILVAAKLTGHVT